jgi:hypothetical protein
MSNLNPQQFRLFHGTNRKTIKGGVINPTKQRGPEWDGDGPHAAFATRHLEEAARYGEHVFEVHPSGDDEHVGDGAVMSTGGYEVKRKMNPEVVKRYSNIFGPIREANEKLEHGKYMHEHNMESWSHEGPASIFHLAYDKDGNEIRTKVERSGDRPKN